VTLDHPSTTVMPLHASSSTTNRTTNVKKNTAGSSNAAPPSVAPGDVEILNADPGDVEILKSVGNDQVKVKALLLDLKAQLDAEVEMGKRWGKEEAATEPERRDVEPEEGGPQRPTKTPQPEVTVSTVFFVHH